MSTEGGPIRPSFLRRHGLPMLLAAVLSSALTAGGILGGQWYLAKGWSAKARESLQASLVGRWDLVESTDHPTKEDAEGRWIEFRPDGSVRQRSFTTVSINGKVASRREDFQTFAYKVADGDTIVFNPDDATWRHQARVTLEGAELTLHTSRAGNTLRVERYRRAEGMPQDRTDR